MNANSGASMFNIGDYIIRLDNDNIAIYMIQRVEDELITVFLQNDKTWSWCIHPKYCRKAEPEEVALGYRLRKYDQNTLGEDNLIENHISPYCKVKSI